MTKISKRQNITLVIRQLSKANLSVFGILDYSRVMKLSYRTAQRSVNRYLKMGILERLSKNLFCLKDKPINQFLIANRLYMPSYISFDTALSYYHIIPETIYNISSATSRKTRELTTSDLIFNYHTIKKNAFCGYRAVKYLDETVLIAEPEKALADYFYFVALKKYRIAYERIDLRKIDRKKLRYYAKLFGNKTLNQLIDKLYAQ